MKKSLFCVACATIALYSCTSSENTENGFQPESLTFGTYVNMNNTSTGRALDKNSFVTDDVIGINACQTSGQLNGDFTNNFMVNEALTKTSSSLWTYANVKFWPINATDKISFVASYPQIAPSINGGKCSFDFTVASDANLQKDFMWSTITDACRTDRNGTYQNGVLEDPNTTPITNVILHFKHALSRIVFNAKAAANYSGASIVVTDITVNNLFGKGTYTLTPSLGKGTWSLKDTQTNNYVALADGTATAIESRFQTMGNSLLLMPQVLNTTAGSKSTVTIKYNVRYAVPAMNVQEERTFDLATAVLKDGNTWEQNKVYNYNFTIALDMITFDATIDGWDNSLDQGLTIN